MRVCRAEALPHMRVLEARCLAQSWQEVGQGFSPADAMRIVRVAVVRRVAVGA